MSKRPVQLPRLYVILDGGTIRSIGLSLQEAASSLRDAGAQLVQYRDKHRSGAEILVHAREIREIFAGSGATLLLNDFPELVQEAGWNGVHVGQGDASVGEARRLCGVDGVVGISTHTPEQLEDALATDADYIAYGPIFETQTKGDVEACVGLEGLQRVCARSDRPVVAIGGITPARLPEIYAAGAASAAVIGAVFQPGRSVSSAMKELLAAATRDR